MNDREYTGLAWHFLRADSMGRPVLIDNRVMTVGKWLVHRGRVVLCSSGYHASTRALDALCYSCGPMVSLVEIEGVERYTCDKFVARRRRAIWCYDASDELRRFARAQALEMTYFWEPPQVVRDYLESGDENLRPAAYDASETAALPATQSDLRNSLRDELWYSARYATLYGSGDVVWRAAVDAAYEHMRADLYRANQFGTVTIRNTTTFADANSMLESLLIAGACERGLW